MISSSKYGSIKDVRAREKELKDFYYQHYYVPVEAIEDSARMKKRFQRHREEGTITRINAARSQAINYGPLRYLCKEHPNRKQFSLYHINDILKVIPINNRIVLDDFEGIDRIFSMKEAEKLTGVDRSTIKDWIKRYSLPFKLKKDGYQFDYQNLKLLKKLKGKKQKEKISIIQKEVLCTQLWVVFFQNAPLILRKK